MDVDFLIHGWRWMSGLNERKIEPEWLVEKLDCKVDEKLNKFMNS